MEQQGVPVVGAQKAETADAGMALLEGGGVALAGGIGIVAAEDGAGRKGGEVGGDEGGDASRGAFLQPSVLTYSLSVQSV